MNLGKIFAGKVLGSTGRVGVTMPGSVLGYNRSSILGSVGTGCMWLGLKQQLGHSGTTREVNIRVGADILVSRGNP